MEELDKENIDVLRAAILEALEGVEKKCGVTIGFSPVPAETGTAVFRLEVAPAGGGERAEEADGGEEDGDPARAFWKKYTRFFSELEPDDFGKVIVLNGRKFTISGINPAKRGKDDMIRLRDGAGRLYLAPPDIVLLGLGRKSAEQKRQEKQDCNRRAAALGLPLRYGDTFTYGRRTYRLDAIDDEVDDEEEEEEEEYPIIATELKSGKQYRLPLEAI